MELLTPGTGLLFWQVVIFLSTLLVLSKFAWKPIMKSLKAREKFINDSLESAKKAEEDAARKKAEDRQAAVAKKKQEKEEYLK